MATKRKTRKKTKAPSTKSKAKKKKKRTMKTKAIEATGITPETSFPQEEDFGDAAQLPEGSEDEQPEYK